ncbi:MAG TPA: maltotransferase domain-containing protein [Stellaceae bacterium]|nr:maltotransferase domain-containing protein [Stellaceae bacterium]
MIGSSRAIDTGASALREGLRIYNLLPTLAGTIREWHRHLPRIAAMGFNAVYVNPFHYPGFSGSLYAVKDYYRLNPRFRGDEPADDDRLLADFTAAAREHGLRAIMDLVANHTSKDSELVAQHPQWFARDAAGRICSPYAIDPDDPTRKTVWGDLAELDYRSAEQTQILAYFQGVVRHYAGLGFGGFRCDAAYKVPVEIWRGLTAAGRAVAADIVFLAETVGASQEAVLALAGAGFDYLYNSVKWWDFKSAWLLDQYEAFRHIAPSIGFPESHDTPRLVTELRAAGVPESEIEPRYRQAYAFAAAYSAGVLMPMGFEFGWGRRFDVVGGREEVTEPSRFDLSRFIAEANALKRSIPALNEEGPQALRPTGDADLVLLDRRAEDGDDRALIIVNRDPRRPQLLGFALEAEGVAKSDPTGSGPTKSDPAHPGPGDLVVEPFEVRVLRAVAAAEPALPMHPLWRPQAHIAIEAVYPELEGGRWPVKRIAGETFAVWADLFRDGHDRLRGIVKYRRGTEAWRETPLTHFDNDRWVARFRLDRPGLWQYTIEAWTDRFGSWREEIDKKREAGQEVTLELAEGRAIVESAIAGAEPADATALRAFLDKLDRGDEIDRGDASDRDAAGVRSPVLLSLKLRDIMDRSAPREGLVRYPQLLEVIVERKEAQFAAWYEMFARSQGREPGRSANFDDCIARLPEIAALRFDVVYLPPIHPIGRTNRKGRDNSTRAEPGDPGSPYAIGAAEGGHCAIEPGLGTLADFRRFVQAAAAQGIAVALDFAVQCAPDHPWVRQHPQWFRFRPDGTIKYAENPPKKYEDIVNFDFDNRDRENLWSALRDIVLFWVEQGVHIFRVDNPHTKPLPFWEWLIREVKTRCPEALFLAEAFTRPKMMLALAKAGFSQSYTYFTWRNTKAELTEYLTELTAYPVVEYFRPNFFTNTPDILPFYLQQGGRAAFRIRLVLAATLSPAYGIYNGFELCENEALTGREEYARSEKYEYKVWDWDRPGNIKDDIRLLNRCRRDNPALQEFANLRFLESDHPDILAYAKISTDRAADQANAIGANAIVVVNLDPHAAHEAAVALPLAELGLAPDQQFRLEEAFTRTVAACRGGRQRFRLDPELNPALLFRLLPDRSA